MSIPIVTVQEVLDFQNTVILPLLAESKVKNFLEQELLMGCAGPGLSFKDLPEEEAQELINMLCVGSFKILRFTPTLLAELKKTKQQKQPMVISGGSCLISSADNSAWRKNLISLEELRHRLEKLPTMMQITDASLPLIGADIFINIVEDSLFAEYGGVYCGLNDETKILIPDFKSEGQRHSHLFKSWQKTFGSEAVIKEALFSNLPITESSSSFWENLEKEGILACTGMTAKKINTLSRSLVMFSYTGAWVLMLKKVGLIPTESVYFVVEPIHHFAETHSQDTGAIGSELAVLNQTFDLFFRNNPYGQNGSHNSQVAGGIAFLPTITGEGRIAHGDWTLDNLPHAKNWQEEIKKYEAELQADKIPSLADDQIFVAGLNWLYQYPECRKALKNLSELWYGILAESHQCPDKKEAKNRRKLLCQDPELLKQNRAARKVLLDHLNLLFSQLFHLSA